MRGQKLVDAEVPALQRGDVGGTLKLAQQARTLTAPADAVFRAAGLGVCVGKLIALSRPSRRRPLSHPAGRAACRRCLIGPCVTLPPTRVP